MLTLIGSLINGTSEAFWGMQWRRHGVDWGGHVHPSFPTARFSNFSKSVEKALGGGS